MLPSAVNSLIAAPDHNAVRMSPWSTAPAPQSPPRQRETPGSQVGDASRAVTVTRAMRSTSATPGNCISCPRWGGIGSSSTREGIDPVFWNEVA